MKCELIGIGTCNKKTITINENTPQERYDKHLADLKSEYSNIKKVVENGVVEWILGGDIDEQNL